MSVHQLDLLTWTPRARLSDPSTSKDAGARAGKFSAGQHRQILDAMRSAGVPLSAEQIGDRLDLNNVRVARRTSELLRAGYITVHDETYINRSGSRARRYVVAA